MNRVLAATFLLAMTAIPARAQADPQPEPEVVYGSDDRLDLYQVKSRKLLQLANSTVALFEASDVKVSAGKATLSTSHYGESYNLCKEERFWEQRSGAFCSGSLVGPDLVMTAGHCVTSQQACDGVKFVFGFGIKKKGRHPASVAAKEVYGCARLLGREQVNSGADWALVKLDRRVRGHAPLKLDRSDAANGNLLFVIGHPAGLPTKVAGGAKVRDASPQGFFVADLDTYGGNSGSAVFNAKTGLVTGILVRGENDYVYKGNCRVSNICAKEACRGEDVTKVGAVAFPRVETAAPRLASFGALLPALIEQQAQALAR